LKFNITRLYRIKLMPERNGQRSQNGRSATARRVLFSGPGSTDGMYTNTNNGGGMKKGGAQPSATGFMVPFGQRTHIAVPALNKDFLFKFRQYYNAPRHAGPMM
jgi:hypothetical protein